MEVICDHNHSTRELWRLLCKSCMKVWTAFWSQIQELYVAPQHRSTHGKIRSELKTQISKDYEMNNTQSSPE